MATQVLLPSTDLVLISPQQQQQQQQPPQQPFQQLAATSMEQILVQMDTTSSTAAARVQLVSKTETNVHIDEPLDVFSQDEPDEDRAIRMRYTFANGSTFVRVFDAEYLNQWIERQPTPTAPRDPIISTLIYSRELCTAIAVCATQSFCRRANLDPTTDGALFVVIRLMADEPLLELLKSVKQQTWTQHNVWLLLEEAVQRRRSTAIAFLYDLGVQRFRFNPNTLVTLILLAFERGWPTRELIRLMSRRMPDRQTHRKLGLPWSHGVIVILTAAVQSQRHRDVGRILRRLGHHIELIRFNQLRHDIAAYLSNDNFLQALFHQYDLRSSGIVVDH